MAYAMRVARPGYSADTCADFETAFDSRFPNLKIAQEGSFTTTSSTLPQTLSTHGLGYAPVFWIYVEDVLGSGNTTLATTGYSQFFRINGTDLIYDGGLATAFTGYYYVFHQRIDQNITYDTVRNTPTTQGSTTTDYAIEVAKAGFDVTTADPKDLAFSSRYPSPIIQKMATGTLTSAVLESVSHGLNYYPQFFMYIRNIFSDSRWSIVFNSFDFQAYSTTSNIEFIYNGFDPTYDYGLLVLKNPIKA